MLNLNCIIKLNFDIDTDIIEGMFCTKKGMLHVWIKHTNTIYRLSCGVITIV